MKISAAVYLGLLSSALALACADSHDPPPDSAADVFEIADVRVNPTTLSCRGNPLRVVLVNLGLVNTMATPVRVLSVASEGVVISSSTPSIVGRTAFKHEKLTILPDSTVVAAETGAATVQVALPVNCGFTGLMVPPTQVDALMHLRLETDAGYFDSKRFVLRLDWVM